jgi:hypothetical protein
MKPPLSAPSPRFTPAQAGRHLGLLLLVVHRGANQSAAAACAWHLPALGARLRRGSACALAVNGQWTWASFDAPRERMMGEVGRVLYVHVPAAWATMVAFLLA